MILSRTDATLRSIEEHENVTIEQILNLFHDIYEDIKSDTGSVLEQQELGQPDEVIARLCWMARTTARICRKNEKTLFSAESEERWNAAYKKLDEAYVELEKEEKKAEEFRQKYKEQKEALERRQSELEADEAEMKGLREAVEHAKEQSVRNKQEIETLQEQERELRDALSKQKTKQGDLRKIQTLLKTELGSCGDSIESLNKKWNILKEAWQSLGDDRILTEVWLDDPGEIQILVERFGNHMDQMKSEMALILKEYRLLTELLENEA